MTPSHPPIPRRRWLAAALSATLLLAACGGGSHGDDHDDEHHVDTLGRLVIADGSTTVRVLDLDGGNVVQNYTLDHAPSALYSSPSHRYALAVQRTQDQVQVIDGGIYQEDHGDHLHDYKRNPALLDWRLPGVRPTHYQAHDGLAAFFMDGLEASSLPAQVVVLTDASIAARQALASLPLPRAMHGTAEPRGNFLLTTYREAGSQSTLPSQVELYQRNGSGYSFVQRFEEACPGLHGSYSNESHSAFGCTDGVLIVTQDGSSFSTRKLPNPDDMPVDARIGTILGHPERSTFIGIASPGHFFDIDPVAGTLTRINWAEGRTRRAHAMDAQGRHLLILDDQGTLHLLDGHAGWAVRARLPAIASMPTAAPFPAIAVNRAANRAYLSDPNGARIVVVDLDTATLATPIALNFNPTLLTWVGIERHDNHAH
ncbi:hypothetical protein [Caldimonas sp.]|uniref:hypothetical protein n=1 Tax=Caldimonas sp. TaxID=2838790 RepID=UPI00307D0A6C